VAAPATLAGSAANCAKGVDSTDRLLPLDPLRWCGVCEGWEDPSPAAAAAAGVGEGRRCRPLMVVWDESSETALALALRDPSAMLYIPPPPSSAAGAGAVRLAAAPGVTRVASPSEGPTTVRSSAFTTTSCG
jgi:hypothetical protein